MPAINTPHATTSKGNYGETAALGFLQSRGYVILERNYKCFGGEIDIIAQHNEYIVFIEVKYRRSLASGLPRMSVTPSKQRKIAKAALGYISKMKLDNTDFRFDVIEVFGIEMLNINHIEDAFHVQ